MADDEKARRERAEQLRKKIGELTDPASETPDPTPERLPGESPNDYVQRRMRELEKKRKAGDEGGAGP